MGKNDDITDAFDDDDELKNSIEAADKRGQWRDGSAAFDDPKVRELARKLAQAPRENYTERRLLELQRRIAAKEADREPPKTALFTDQVAPLEQVFMTTPSADDWREPPRTESTATPTTPPMAVLPPPPRIESSAAAVLACLRCLAASAVVFAIAGAVQGLLTGWSISLLVRSSIAAGTAGLAWFLASAGRFRSAAIGIGVHLLAFLGDTQTGNQTQLLATLLGMLVVLIGSGAAGIMNEEPSSAARPR
ncbi:MAG: hypothetical protein MUC36_14245 [Planctomycetes bacterium]|jgi:hypothetical protein|nr:hypothetical protein [Planctomycetota bacterium]